MFKKLEQWQTLHSLDKYRRNAYVVTDFDLRRSRYVIFSDLHKGDARPHVDEFMPNKTLYSHALRYYLDHDFGLILNGDIEESWKNDYATIINTYADSIYALERAFAQQGPRRHLRIWGNHDLDWQNPRHVQRHLNPVLGRPIQVHGAVLLGDNILITHGHQGDPRSDNFGATFSRVFVRYIWQALQRWFGLKIPVITDINVTWRPREQFLHQWAVKRRHLLIAGHTHRPMFAAPFKSPTLHYINSGSCLATNTLHCVEIEHGEIRLVQWAADHPAPHRAIQRNADLGGLLAAI